MSAAADEERKQNLRAVSRAYKAKVHGRHRHYYLKNREKIKKQRREYRQNNKEKIAQYQHEYHQKNRKRIAAIQRDNQRARRAVIKPIPPRDIKNNTTPFAREAAARQERIRKMRAENQRRIQIIMGAQP